MFEAPQRPVGEVHPPLLTQLLRFAVTGGLAAIMDLGTLILLMHFGMYHTPAKAISFVFGTTTAYVINRRWTFGAGPSSRRFTGVLVLYGATFCVQVGLFTLLYSLMVDQLPRLWVQSVAFVIAQGVATAVNFLVQRMVIFRLMR